MKKETVDYLLSSMDRINQMYEELFKEASTHVMKRIVSYE